MMQASLSAPAGASPPEPLPPSVGRASWAARRRRLVQLVSVALALSALLWLLRRIGWSQIGDALARVGWQGALLLGVISLSESFLDGAALWVIMGPPLRLLFAVTVNCAGSVLNLVLPWESGEVLKGGLLKKHFSSQGAISGTIIWNYVFKMSRPTVSAAAALYACCFCPDLPTATMVILLVANVLAFLPYVLLRVLVRFGAAAGLLKVLRFIPGVRRHPAHWIELARQIDVEVQGFWRRRPRDFLKVFFLQVVARGTGWLSIFACFKLLGLPYTFAQATLMYGAMNVADYVIALLPARVGVSEGTAFFAFKLLGLSPELGVIVFVILRLRTITANGLCAPFAFLDWAPATSSAASAGSLASGAHERG